MHEIANQRDSARVGLQCEIFSVLTDELTVPLSSVSCLDKHLGRLESGRAKPNDGRIGPDDGTND